MTDTTLPPGDEAGDRIEPVDIQQEMQRSYIDYAMSVIVGRALPEVRDGLKPVHRRVLYAMYDSGFRPDRSHAKSARSVAETMGNYHPHGDSSIYDTLVRMAQPWSLRYPLVDGQGNFGSPGNDPRPPCGTASPVMRWCACHSGSRCGSRTSFRRAAELGQRRRPQSARPARQPGRRRSTVPLRRASDVHGAHRRGLRGHRHGEPPAAVPGRRGGVPTLLWKLIEEIRPGDVRGDARRVCTVLVAKIGVEHRHTPHSRRAGLEDFLSTHGDDRRRTGDRRAT